MMFPTLLQSWLANTLVCLTLFDGARSQVLPAIPAVSPSPSPSVTPLPTPAPIQRPTPGPSPLGPTKPPQLLGTPPAHPAPTTSPPPNNGDSSSEPAPGSGPLGGTEPEANCTRNISVPKPYLGTSPVRYTFSVLGSVAAVATASALYSVAADWDVGHRREFFRFSCILLSRVLIVAAVKVSAALVAAIANAQPYDTLNGALDASGAFLTWASAILTRGYYEGWKMTKAAVEFYNTSQDMAWDRELRRYLSPRYARIELVTNDMEKGVGAYEEVERGNPEYSDDEESHQQVEMWEEEEHQALHSEVQGLSFRKRITGGRIDRKLVLLNSLFFIIVEICLLIEYLLQLLKYLTRSNALRFEQVGHEGQCGIRSKDVPGLVGLIIVQLIYTLTQQPSLVPLLIFAASTPRSTKGTVAKICRHLRGTIAIVLVTWVVSLLCLPLFLDLVEPMFVVGDLSLYWYVIIAPPSYAATTYQIGVAFAVTASIIGGFISFRLWKDAARRKERHWCVGKDDSATP